MSRQHQYRSGYIARAWSLLPTVTRVRGAAVQKDASLLLLGNGTNGSNNNVTVVDSSVNNQTITKTNNPPIGSANPFAVGPAYDPSTHGGSIHFTAAQSSRISAPNNQTLYDFGTGDFTIEWWMYNTVNWTSQTNPGIMGHKAGDSTAGWQIYRNGASNTTRLNIRLSAGGGTNLDYHSNSTPTVGVWEHYAVTREGTTLRWFKDGVLTNTHTNVTVNVSGSTGLFYMGFTQTWSGYGSFLIAGAHVVKGTALYTANFTKPTALPTEVSGTSILLKFANANIIDTACTINVNTNGNAAISNNQSKFGGTSMLFDGSTDYLNLLAHPSLNMNTNPFTIEWWMRTAGTQDGNSTIFSKFNNTNYSGGTNVLTITNASTGTYANKIAVDLVGSPVIASTTNPNDNAWHHVAYSRAGTEGFLFIDGNLEGRTSSYSSSTAIDLGTSRIGRAAANTTANFDYWGYIDDFRITPGLVYTASFTPTTTEAVYNNISTYSVVSNNIYGVRQTNIKTNDLQVIAPFNDKGLPLNNIIARYDAALLDSYPGTGTTVYDISGDATAQDLVMYNGVTWTSTSPGYFSFDGVNDIMGTSTVMPTTMSSTTDGIFTIMVWFRTGNTTQGRKILGFENPADVNTSSAYDRQFYITTSGTLNWGIYSGGARPIIGPSLSANTWYCATAVQRRSPSVQNQLYVNGVSYGTTPYASNDVTNNALYLKVGGRGLTGWTGGTTGYWSGDIGMILLYDRAMTTEEVQELYNITRGRFE